ncbi:MAG: hypothetical protein OEM52_10515 [bacterium]|nr:hypothetical protein [bacterium]
MKEEKCFALLIAGVLVSALTVFQIIVSFSPEWSLYFGAPEEITTNPSQLLVVGFVAAVFFFVFALYAFSGQGVIRRLPFLRIALVAIAAIFVLRGCVLFLLLAARFGIVDTPVTNFPVELTSAIISLIIGFFYSMGTYRFWEKLNSANAK